MTVIQIQRKIDSDTLRLPELRALIGKTVEITVTEIAPGERDCLESRDTAAPPCAPALEGLRDRLTAEQYEALAAIASAGGPDAEAIRRLRAASMT
jgi:hypothetical protein